MAKSSSSMMTANGCWKKAGTVARLIRRYRYDWRDRTYGLRLREYGRKGGLISDIILEQAPADELYRVPPPRSGNILDEDLQPDE